MGVAFTHNGRKPHSNGHFKNVLTKFKHSSTGFYYTGTSITPGRKQQSKPWSSPDERGRKKTKVFYQLGGL